MSISPITYTVQNVADYVKRIFGDESAVQMTDMDIIRWVNAAQREIVVTNDILKAVSNTDIVSGQADYPLTSLNILNIQSLRFNNTKLRYMSFQEAEEYILNHDPEGSVKGTSVIWYEYAGVISLWPVPDADITNGLRVNYTKSPTAVTALVDNLSVPDQFFNRVIEYVLGQAYEMDEDSQNSQFKLTQFADRLNVMAEQDNRHAVDYYPSITVMPEDSW